MNDKLLSQLECIYDLKYGWDGYNAPPIPIKIIENVSTFLRKFELLNDAIISPLTAPSGISLYIAGSEQINFYSDKIIVRYDDTSVSTYSDFSAFSREYVPVYSYVL